MKKHFYLSAIFLFLVIGFQSVHGQSAEEERKAHEQRTQEQIEKANIQIVTGNTPKNEKNRNDGPPISDNVSKDATRLKEMEDLKKANEEYIAQLNILRSPHPDDLSKYQNFLQQKNTGLFKLFPNHGCNSGGVIRVDGNCENAVNDSYSYSFQKQNYFGGEFHDIRLEEGKLWLDGFLSQGIITDVGGIPLEDITLQSDYAKFLINFKPEKESAAVKAQFWEISKKINSNGFSYGKVIKPIINTTYLARIINYRLDKSHNPKHLGRNDLTREIIQFLFTFIDKKRFDSVVAFRIVRIDSDSSVSILWKQLAENKSPDLKFAKDEKWTDFKTK